MLALAAAAALLCAGCAAVAGLEGAAAERAKQPIIITLYHGHF